jgi:phage-related minor tail protein
MTDSTASLIVAIDSTAAKQATVDLDKLTESGSKVDAQFSKTGESASSAGVKLSAMSQINSAAAMRAIELAKATEEAAQKMDWARDAANKLASDQMKAQNAAMTFTKAQIDLANGVEAATVATKAATEAQTGHSFSMGSSLAKMEALRVAHDALIGSYTRMGSSMFVLGNATGITTQLFSAQGIAILAPVAALAALGFAIFKSAEEMKAMNDALIMTGNYAGTTGAGLDELAHSAAAAGGSLSESKRIVTELAASGKYTAEQIGSVTDAVIAMQHATGESDKEVDKLVKQFESLSVQATNHKAYSSAISTNTLKLNDEFHFLTETIFLEIQALEKEGKQKEASALATETLANATKDRAEEMIKHVGTVVSAWQSLKKVISDTIDLAATSVTNIGNDDPAVRVKVAASKVRELSQGYNQTPGREDERLKWVKELVSAQEALNNANDVAAQQSEKERVAAAAEHASAEQTLIDKTRLKRSEGERQSQLDSFHERIAKWKDDAALNGTVNPNLNNDYITEETLKIIKDTEVHTAHAKAVKVTKDAYASFMEELAKYDAKTRDMAVNEGNQTGVQKDQMAGLYKLVDAYKAGKMSLDEFHSAEDKLQASLDGRSAIENAAQQAKDAAIATQAYDDALKSLQSTGAKEAESLTKAIDAQRLHNEEIGKTKAQVEQAKAAEQYRITALLEGDAQILDSAIQVAAAQAGFDAQTLALWEEKLKSLREQIALRQQLSGELARGSALEANAAATKKSFEEWKKGWDETDKLARQVFTDWGMQGTNMAKQIGDTLKKALLSAIYEATIKPIAFSIYSSVTGGSVGASGALNGISNASTLANMGAGYGIGNTAGTMVANATGTGLDGFLATNGAFGTAGGAMGALGTAMPWIGGALALMSLLGGNKTKSSSNSGDASATYDASGALVNLNSTNALSASATSITAAMQSSYVNTAKALGIGLAQSNFNVNTNTGKQGENPMTIIDANFANGKYSSGEISSADQAGLSLAASRALMTALQSSELPKYLSGVFDGITASSATQQQITDSLNAATALKQFNDALMLMPDHFQQLATLSYAATQGLIAASGGLDKLQTNLGTYYTNFYSAEEQRQQTIKNINAATAGSGLDAATATRDQFKAIVESQNLTTESGQKMYAALLGVSGAFASITQSADDLAKASAADVAKVLKDKADAALKVAQAQADAAKSVNDALIVAAKVTADQAANLQTQWMTLIGDSVGLRQQELAAIDSTNQAMQKQIWAYQDAQAAITAASGKSDSALAAIQKAEQAQVTSTTTTRNAIKGVFDLITSETAKLYQSVSSTAAQSVGEANAYIESALLLLKTGGTLPDQSKLSSAVSAASSGFSDPKLSTFEADNQRLILAGKLSQMSDLIGPQLTTAEQQLAVTSSAYDTAKAQLDTLRGINDATLSVADAIEAFQVALTGEKTARQALEAAKDPASSGGGGINDKQRLLADNAAADVLWMTRQIDNMQRAYTDGVATGGNAGVLAANLVSLNELKATANATIALAKTSETYAAGMAVVAKALSTGTPTATAISGNANATVFDAVSRVALTPYATGTNYVPHDGPAYLHQGEAVVPKAYNPAAGGGQSNARLESLVEGLTKEVQRLQGIVNDGNTHARRTADTLDNVTEGGSKMRSYTPA